MAAHALHDAIYSQDDELVEALLRIGYSTDIPDFYGNTPLSITLFRCNSSVTESNTISLKIIELLLAFGINLHKEKCLHLERNLENTMPNRYNNERSFWNSVLLENLRELRQSNILYSLKRACRKVIRRYLGKKADEIICNLTCLPENLRVYLLVKNEPPVLKMPSIL